MPASYSEKLAREILEKADIRPGGDRPWDVQVRRPEFYDRVLSRGSLGLGESYMDGWWDCEQLDEAVARLLKIDAPAYVRGNWRAGLLYLAGTFTNLGRRGRAFEVGEKHYDLGNDLYRAMLDKRMVYTCAYWREADNLDKAQEAKLDLICRKIGLEPGMKVLDIGCGWGSFMVYAAQKYGVEAEGVTVSGQQAELARQMAHGLPVKVELKDYREIRGRYDRVVSLGMFEHVGYKNYGTFFEVVRRSLEPDGLFLLHTIGTDRTAHAGDPWLNKYIFPNGMLPSPTQIGRAAEGRFVLEDWHNFGPYYDLTARAWYANFERHWPELKKRYDERFRRMWRYYLLSCAGAFRARHMELWQMVFSPHGVPGGYRSVR